MSIEIIEKPTHKCSVCGCVFAFDKEDLKINPLGVQPKTGDVYAVKFLQCPICDTFELAFKDNVIKL